MRIISDRGILLYALSHDPISYEATGSSMENAMKFSLMGLATLSLTLLSFTAAPAIAAPDYRITRSVALGTPDRWDYVVFDAGMNRVYVAHGDRVTVVDARSGEIVGQVGHVPGGTHGTGISSGTGQGFTDDGRAGQVVAFDLKSLKIAHRIKADVDADAIVFDKATGHIFIIEGDPAAITVIDPQTDTVAATIKAGEKMEYAAADDKGTIFVAGEANSDILRIDARTNKVTAQWPTPDCTSPHGLAIDKAAHRLFMGCVNKLLMVVDADNGHVIAALSIGKGSDAVAFDPIRKRVFSSNGGDGTVTVYQQTSADVYKALDPIITAVSGRTMAIDPVSGRLFVAVADTDPNPVVGKRAVVRPGTLKLLFIDPK
jgi:DNA-binding beta-propeller fold protein YncE